MTCYRDSTLHHLPLKIMEYHLTTSIFPADPFERLEDWLWVLLGWVISAFPQSQGEPVGLGCTVHFSRVVLSGLLGKAQGRHDAALAGLSPSGSGAAELFAWPFSLPDVILLLDSFELAVYICRLAVSQGLKESSRLGFWVRLFVAPSFLGFLPLSFQILSEPIPLSTETNRTAALGWSSICDAQTEECPQRKAV